MLEKIKTNYISSLAIFLILFFGILYLLFPHSVIKNGNTDKNEVQNNVPKADISIEKANANNIKMSTNKIYNGVELKAEFEGQTIYELLSKHLPVKFKKYDYGISVDTITGEPKSKNKLWAIYKNGEFVGSDISKNKLKKGDTVKIMLETAERFKGI